MSADEPRLDKIRHVRYWTRCLKTYLPHHYTGNDSNRMYLAFFIISALDILGAWETITKPDERNDYINWIYRCQHPDGGFRMWPGTDFGDRSTEANAKWDPANIPATYFALSALLIVGDDLKRVKRQSTLEWLKRMQRPDGSFGETLVDGHIEGGQDPRFGYCATGARHILRGDSEGSLSIDGTVVEDIDVDSLVRCISAAESYDGGIADEPLHEPHAGYTFCSLGCLNFIKRLNTGKNNRGLVLVGPSDPDMTLRWLAACQTDLLDPDDEAEEQSLITAHVQEDSNDQNNLSINPTTPLHQSPDKSTPLSLFDLAPLEAGMSGRYNKVADTCYGWWAGASFHLLDQQVYEPAMLRRYLLGSTQHLVLGGFGKFPGDLPDLYHSNLGLATLGLMGVEDVKPVDAAMCISKEASSRLPALWKSFTE